MPKQLALRLTSAPLALALTVLPACSKDSTSAPAPTALVPTAGQQVSGTAGLATGAAPTLQVNDANGRPVKGVVVHFAVSSGGGSIAATSDTSDADGRATAGTWTLGRVAGVNVVTATSPRIAGVDARFTATGQPGAAARLGFRAVPTTVRAAVTITPAITVEVRDEFHNRVTGSTIPVTIALAGAPASARLEGTTTTNAVAGLATFADISVTEGGSGWSMTASSPSLPTTLSPITVSALAPSAILTTAGDGLSAVVGDNTSTPPTVQVVSAGNVPFAGATVTFRVISGGGVIATTSMLSDAQGFANAGFWDLGGRAGLQRVVASVDGANAVLTAHFTATATPGPPASIVKLTGDNQSAAAGTVTPIAPRVRVLDQYGNGVPGIAVAFIPRAGSGSVPAGSVGTNAIGEAAASSWTLGATSGINRLEAYAGVDRTTHFAATGTSAGDAYFNLVAGGDQLARAGATVSPVTVALRSTAGAPVPGATVTFAVATGGGSLTNATVTSDANGVATLEGWRLGSIAGVQEVTASAPGATPLLVRARAYPASSFDVSLRFMETPTARQQQSFDNAVARWRQLIIGDLADITITAPGTPANACFTGMPSVAESIDDLLIFVRLIAIDGPGQVLGSARPCFVRTEGRSTLIGVMTFDVADLATLESRNELDAVILHEMGHVLGIGSSWESFALVQGRGGVDPYFTGQHTTAGFAASGGMVYTGNPVPVDNSTGANAGGTRDVHWREPTLGRELMTGYFNSGAPNPLSIISVASLADMGYQVSYIAADPYAVPGSESAGSLMGVQASPRQLIEAPPTGEQFVWDATERIAVPISKWTKGFTRPTVRNPKPVAPPPLGPRSSRVTP